MVFGLGCGSPSGDASATLLALASRSVEACLFSVPRLASASIALLVAIWVGVGGADLAAAGVLRGVELGPVLTSFSSSSSRLRSAAFSSFSFLVCSRNSRFPAFAWETLDAQLTCLSAFWVVLLPLEEGGFLRSLLLLLELFLPRSSRGG